MPHNVYSARNPGREAAGGYPVDRGDGDLPLTGARLRNGQVFNGGLSAGQWLASGETAKAPGA